MEKISWTDCVINEAVLHRIWVGGGGERNILPKIKKFETNWIGHNLHRNCVLKYFVEGKIERTKRYGRKRTQLLNDLKEKRKYCSWKKEALDRPLWRNSFQRVRGPVTRQNTQ